MAPRKSTAIANNEKVRMRLLPTRSAIAAAVGQFHRQTPAAVEPGDQLAQLVDELARRLRAVPVNEICQRLTFVEIVAHESVTARVYGGRIRRGGRPRGAGIVQ